MKREQVLALYDAYADSIYRVALGYLRSPHDAEDAVQAVFCKLMELPEKYRVVIVLHCMEGYALSEIAGFLHITTSAVSMRLHRARKMLDEQLGRD